MATLTRELRRSLENTVREARRVAEGGARKVIEQLAVHHHEPYTNMTPEQRDLRNALRAHGRQLGDRRDSTRGTQAIERLTTECAYEHWHRMLFARFLAESNLLIEPESGMDITLEDCQELARERGEDWLELASQFAERMLPQIFRTNDPVLKLALPPETRAELEKLLKALAREVFIADDSLGWVYQYWQADKKDEVNRSETKIGADELPAVTQLFTEDYMVFFLLHNTLGAWWAGKVLAANPELAKTAKSEDELRAACGVGDVDWKYLRFVRDGDGPWRPAAGSFESWPKAAKGITILDPCMGSGHFLVFALPMVAALRGHEESLSSDAAIEASLRENLFGLEIDPRCTQIAAFNLAFAAWKRIGYRPLPPMHLACSGLSIGVTKAEWLKLAERVSTKSGVPPKTDLLGTEENLFSDAMKRGFETLYELFARAPWLGSLIEPRGVSGDLIEQGFTDIESILFEVMAKTDSADLSEMAVAAQGMTKAAELLAGRFTLVTTNVPYLGRGNQDEVLRDYSEKRHTLAKGDLATCFVERCTTYCSTGGTCALVTPRSWLFQKNYQQLRANVLSSSTFNMIARLGARAFESISGEVVNVALVCLSNDKPPAGNRFPVWEASDAKSPGDKNAVISSRYPKMVDQENQSSNPGYSIGDSFDASATLLSAHCDAYQGLCTSDDPQFIFEFWEFPRIGKEWRWLQSSGAANGVVGGCSSVLLWEDGTGRYYRHAQALKAEKRLGGWKSGGEAWEKRGIGINVNKNLFANLYAGEFFDNTVAALIPKDESEAAAIFAFCSSAEYRDLLRGVDPSLSITEHTLLKVPFDFARWQSVANEVNAGKLPAPFSEDPTQWVFDGQPWRSSSPLQVAVARLAGYQWPRQTGSKFADCEALSPDRLGEYADRDGIVALSPVKGERPASDRLTALLAEAYGDDWSAAKLNALLSSSGFAGKTLDDWLRDGFFIGHCELFRHKPFIWHVWDGRRDGFHALVNYHRLAAPSGEGRRVLEKLIYTYLGDWIDRQRADQQSGVEGADARLAAAEHLKSELVSVLHGEPPYDIFVRWKSLEEQPVGWEPDINDGVRINIRPFVTAKPFGARSKGACILRTTPKVKWDKDRGKEPQRPKEDFPWFWDWDEATPDFPGGRTFNGSRWTDLHYSRAFKEAARARRKK